MDLVGLEKTGKMLEDRIAMITPQQVKNIADNVEMTTAAWRTVSQVVADVATAWRARLMPKDGGGQ